MLTYMYLQTQKPHCISLHKCCISSYNQPFNPLFPNKGGVRNLICEVQAPCSCSKIGQHYPLEKSLSIGLSPLDRDLSSRQHYPPFEHYWALDGCFFIQGHNFQTLVSLKEYIGGRNKVFNDSVFNGSKITMIIKI